MSNFIYFFYFVSEEFNDATKIHGVKIKMNLFYCQYKTETK